jgi:hypothetical protein
MSPCSSVWTADICITIFCFSASLISTNSIVVVLKSFISMSRVFWADDSACDTSLILKEGKKKNFRRRDEEKLWN